MTEALALTEFLLACLLQDEVESFHQRVDQHPYWTEARMLADVAAKRAIVESEPEQWPAEMNGTSEHERWEWVCRALASVYADRPGYREEWRVDVSAAADTPPRRT